MNSLDDLPKRESTHDIAEAAETAFREAIGACKLFIIQREDRNDYGTDIQIEARDGKSMTNIRAHIQLKGTTTSVSTNGSISIAVARTNLNYLLAQANSLYICFHLPSERLFVRCADEVFRDYENHGMNWTHQKEVTIRFAQLFDEKFQHFWNARLLASGKLSRDQRLQWIATPPDKILAVVRQSTANIEVPADSNQSKSILHKLYQSGNDRLISKAFPEFEAVLDSFPSVMLLAYLAEINIGLNGLPFDEFRVNQGILKIHEAMEKKAIYKGSGLYCIGNGWLALREFKKAIATYREAMAWLDTPSYAKIAAMCSKNMGFALERLGEMNKARALYERALELEPDLSEALFALGLWHRQKGDDLLLALEYFDRVVQQMDSALEISSVQGWRIDLLFNTGNTKGAFREVYNLISTANQLDWVWPWCAKNIARFGKINIEAAQKSLRFWDLYLHEHPEDIRAERERLVCLWHIRAAGKPAEIDYNEFKMAVIKLIENGDPEPAYLWDRMGHWAQYDENWLEAERAYRRAYEIEPELYGYCLGTALNFLKRFSEALPILIRQAKEYQPDAMSWFQVAVAREGIGDIKGSILAYQRVLELDADYELAWFNLGGIYWNSGDTMRATGTWSQALTRFPDHKLARKLRRDLPFLFDGKNDDTWQDPKSQ